MKDNAENGGPVFIVGVNGSGTTMLADSLGHHPNLYMFPEETKVLPHFISRIMSYGNLAELPSRRKLANELGKCWAYWETNDRKPVVLDNKILNEPGFVGVLNSLYGQFALLEGKTRWGEKTPMYLQHMFLLGTHIPKAKFVHIYRDGRDVAQSLHRRWKRESRRTVYRWKKILKAGRTQGMKLGPSRYMEISYEKLTSDPEQHMRCICDFLDLEYHPCVLKSSMPYLRDTKSNNETGRIIKNSEKWRTYFTANQVEQLEFISGELLDELGYTIVTSAGNHDPSKLQLVWWKLNDRIWQALDFFRKRGIMAAGRFIRRAMLSFIQDKSNRF